ncbi:hypothetical protein ABEO87_13320, partial [Geobacillus stearothermophilus]
NKKSFVLTLLGCEMRGFSAIAVDVYVLLGFTLLFMILNVAALKKYRKL